MWVKYKSYRFFFTTRTKIKAKKYKKKKREKNRSPEALNKILELNENEKCGNSNVLIPCILLLFFSVFAKHLHFALSLSLNHIFSLHLTIKQFSL